MKRSILLCLVLLLGRIAYGQQATPSQTAAATVGDAQQQPTLDATMKFILDTTNDSSSIQPNYGRRGSYSMTSPARCVLQWNEAAFGAAGFVQTDGTNYVLSLSEVDPNRISVHGTDWIEGYFYGFQIAIMIRPGGQLADKTHVTWRRSGSLKGDKQTATVAAVCVQGDKSCNSASTKESQVSLLVKNEETAHRLAHALRHAAVLCGATSPTPF